MCGIVGYFGSAAEVPWIADATACARHRGPDGSGYWVPGMTVARPAEAAATDAVPPADVIFGFQRLAILDLSSAADQPMVNDGAALIFNGEIYNFLELRRELEAKGRAFRSTGDTEVLLAGWLEWGEDVLRRLNGMFALAIYDPERDAVLLARDRFGEKPLFWTRWRQGVAFASEVKQLAALPGVSLQPDLDRARSYLTTLRPYDGPSSWFAGVHQVPAGTALWVRRDEVREAPYFDLAAEVRSVRPEPSAAAWADRFSSLFRESVELRLQADVPVGTSLSAGVDSSAVAAQITALGHRNYHSFTLGSDDRAVDETAEARAFAAEMGSQWHGVRATAAEFAGALDRLTYHQEAPVASTSVYGQYKVMQAARQAGVIVLLDGQGADEVLGGYHKFYAAVIISALRRRDPDAVRLLAGFVRQLQGLGAARNAGPHLRRIFRRAGPAASLGLPPGGASGPDPLADPLRMRLDDVTRWSLPNLLSYADRNSMAHGVEVRLPFLDHRLAALALAMPTDVLIRDGWTKWPLRRVLADLGGGTPAWKRGKRWFGVPQSAWLRRDLVPCVEDAVRDPHPVWNQLLHPARLQEFHAAWASSPGSTARDQQLFAVMALDRFFRVWFA